MSLFKIKICGITNSSDLGAAVEAGADAIGLNFYGPSVRSVTVQEAAWMAAGLKGAGQLTGVKLVGVFVNHSIDEIVGAVKAASLSVIQLHGDERPRDVPPLQEALAAAGLVRQPAIIRAVRLGKDVLDSSDGSDVADCETGSGALAMEVGQWKAVGTEMVLLDAAVPGSYGGTGHQLDWHAVGSMELELPVALAGGLNADNVADAIKASGAAAVDVASGVERPIDDGMAARKDHGLVRRFINNARTAFAER